ncbi:RBBP9/YdeN family alpha/beta hydrolase [Hydrogenophaga sp. BPS33]|uniref:RBBP9/YdeN family alpha/beta hydrolase n=1 Tax=Hydrogenophaga sp. BPS33 TaxID=2651974 RepID=UPI00132010F7|nr:alpha/beta hydrolase [Hydrogenophaga sp. BPS33]QHE87408.1 alpha/beta hydrolase [Hydrogenophaga sp. BPS33]
MNTSPQATVLIVPGLRDHVEDHWQTHLERKLSAERKVVCVPPLEIEKLSCAARVSAIQRTIEGIDGPVLVVAHSGGVAMLMHWAQQHDTRAVQGALLAAPPDFESPLPAGYPTKDTLEANGWLPVPRRALSFRSIVAASTNDPLAKFDRVTQVASEWGSELVTVGAVGHLNPASGFGEWPMAERLIHSLEF